MVVIWRLFVGAAVLVLVAFDGLLSLPNWYFWATGHYWFSLAAIIFIYALAVAETIAASVAIWKAPKWFA